ncbi:hypothetical protein V502_01836 [Pseudogymnoascus sp. VKM F-4520 (FW-2644)]|nr:hypothetical protein V502_01836 [Pseudogymnoascus sp. VKM F-4520 (FW-2644)]
MAIPTQILAESELMKNQIHADGLSSNPTVETLQTSDGAALVFYVRPDPGTLFLIQEVANSPTGWSEKDLSSSLRALHGNAPIAVTHFAVSQNQETARIDIAVVIRYANTDYLYMALKQPSNPSTWPNPVPWIPIPFDATNGSPSGAIQVAAVYLMRMPSPTDEGYLNCFVDLSFWPSAEEYPIATVDRYYIQMDKAPHWVRQKQPPDELKLVFGTYTSCLGRRAGDLVAGIYTKYYDYDVGIPRLAYIPAYNPSGDSPPTTISLYLPENATAIASAMNADGTTDLWIITSDVLWAYISSEQTGEYDPAVVVQPQLSTNGDIFQGTQFLSVSYIETENDFTAECWGVNGNGDLFRTRCPGYYQGWTQPVALLSDVFHFRFFQSMLTSSVVLLAQVGDDPLIQMAQNAVTTTWTQRTVLLEPTDVYQMNEYNSFTTHIEIADSNGNGVPNTSIMLTAVSPVSVYINHAYHIMGPDIPVSVTTDPTGTVTVIEETQTLSGVNFQVEVPGLGPLKEVDPQSNVSDRLSTIKSGDDLMDVTITAADGSKSPLIPKTVAKSDADHAASLLQILMFLKKRLPSDGSRQVQEQTSTGGFAKRTTEEWRKFARSQESTGRIFEMLWGDFHRFLHKVWKYVDDIYLETVDGVVRFVVKIGEEICSAVLDSVAAVLGAVEFVFKNIEVDFDDLMKWLGFIFNWPDIVRTHNVVKNVLRQYGLKAVDAINDLETDIQNEFNDIEDRIKQWASLPSKGTTIGSFQQQQSDIKGAKSPQSNWALFHTKSNMDSVQTSYEPDAKWSEQLQKAIDALLQEWDSAKDGVENLATEAVDLVKEASTLTPTEFFEKLSADLANFLLNFAEAGMLGLVKVIEILAENAMDLLDAPISIPVLSSMYRKISGGNELSFLDLICLVIAIPSTVIYKLANNAPPFPAGPTTQLLSNAAGLHVISQIVRQNDNFTKSDPQTRDLLERLTIVANIAATPASILIGIITAEKFATPDGVPQNKNLGYVNTAVYLGYILPDIVGGFSYSNEWYTIMNDKITACSFLKTFVDGLPLMADVPGWKGYISPLTDSYMNCTWIVPAVGYLWEHNDKGSDWTGFVANMFFDYGGVLSVLASKDIVGAEAAAVGTGVAIACSIGYGVMSFVTAGQVEKENYANPQHQRNGGDSQHADEGNQLPTKEDQGLTADDGGNDRSANPPEEERLGNAEAQLLLEAEIAWEEQPVAGKPVVRRSGWVQSVFPVVSQLVS